MNEELRKRLEEAAKEIIHKHYNCLDENYPCSKASYCVMCGGHNGAYDCCECGADDLYEGILIGAELGYREAITRAKEYLSDCIHDEEHISSHPYREDKIVAVFDFDDDKEAILSDFERVMNGPWEEKK